MASLPRITCNGYVFNPVKKQQLTISYEIGIPLEEKQWVVTKRDNDQFKTQTVNASQPYSIESELGIIHQMRVACFLSAMGGILATGISACFTIAKKNFHIGGGSLALAGVCAVMYNHFNKQNKVASFGAANTIVSAFRKAETSLYQPADYGL